MSLPLVILTLWAAAFRVHAAQTSCATDRPDLERISKQNLAKYQIHLTEQGNLPIHISRYRGALDESVGKDDARHIVRKTSDFFSFLSAGFEVTGNQSFDRTQKSATPFSEDELAKLFLKLNEHYSHKIHVVFVPLPKNVCGLTLLPPHSSQGIALSTAPGCDPVRSFAHEMGHFLMLPHTFEEKKQDLFSALRRHNDCKYSDDGFCSTPFDPGLGYHNVDQQCRYTGGGGFNAPTRNIMSYTRDECADEFTDEQKEAMLKFYNIFMKANQQRLRIEIEDAPDWAASGENVQIKYSSHGLTLVQAYIVKGNKRVYLGSYRPSYNGEDEGEGSGLITFKVPKSLEAGSYQIVIKDALSPLHVRQDLDIEPIDG